MLQTLHMRRAVEPFWQGMRRASVCCGKPAAVTSITSFHVPQSAWVVVQASTKMAKCRNGLAQSKFENMSHQSINALFYSPSNQMYDVRLYTIMIMRVCKRQLYQDWYSPESTLQRVMPDVGVRGQNHMSDRSRQSVARCWESADCSWGFSCS